MEEKILRLDEINIHSLFRALLKNLWVVLLLCASAVLCYTSVTQLNHVPRYTSSATFMVSAKDSTSAYNSLTTTQNMASVFMEVFRSNVLREKVAQQMPDGEFDGTINTQTIPETNLLIVSVTSHAPATSFRALNLIVENYASISDYIFANAQLEVIKDPVVPITPSNPLNPKAQYPLIIVLAAVVGFGLVGVLYILRNTVQNPKAARRRIDGRLLRVIHHEKKNKVPRLFAPRKNIAPLITNALTSKRFLEDNLGLCSALDYSMRKRGQKVIVITSVGENEGKSTVAANLAISMAEKEKKVVLLDCDFRKPSMHKIFETEVPRSNTLSAYLLGETQEYLTEVKKHGISVGFSQHSHRNIASFLNGGKLEEALEALRKQADYIILDTPPMLAAADAEALAAIADTALVITRADFMPVDMINDGLERLEKSAKDVCGIVLNDYHKGLL